MKRPSWLTTSCPRSCRSESSSTKWELCTQADLQSSCGLSWDPKDLLSPPVSPASSCCHQPAPCCWGSAAQVSPLTHHSLLSHGSHSAVSPTFILSQKQNSVPAEFNPITSNKTTTATSPPGMVTASPSPITTHQCWPCHSGPSDITTPGLSHQT